MSDIYQVTLRYHRGQSISRNPISGYYTSTVWNRADSEILETVVADTLQGIKHLINQTIQAERESV